MANTSEGTRTDEEGVVNPYNKVAICARWFLDNGVRVFPIKARDKVPACASWDDYRATVQELDAWSNYGAALGVGASLGVVDSDSPEIENWVAANVPPTSFMVDTARGVHRYYRLIGAATHFIHRAGHTIEFRNTGQYVVGPGSIHSTGRVYVAREWSWQIQDVPFFPVNDFQWDDRPDGERGYADGEMLVLPTVIKAGERHDLLFKLMRSLQARGVDDVEQLLTILRAENRAKCSPPIDDAELTRYIRRVAKHRDRPGFNRLEILEPEEHATAVAGKMIEAGASVDAAIAAAKALDPAFDPSGNTTPQTKAEIEAEIADIERQLALARAGEESSGEPEQLEIVEELDEASLEVVDVEEIE